MWLARAVMVREFEGCSQMRRFMVGAIWLLLIGGLVLACEQSGEGAGQDRDAIGFAAEGYLDNREAFPFLRCRYTVVNGMASSIDDAVEGKLAKRVVREGVWVVDGDRMKYELVCDPAVVKEGLREARKAVMETQQDGTSSANYASVPCLDKKVLKYGEFILTTGSLGFATIQSGAEATTSGGVRETPWGINIMGPDEILNPGAQLRACLRNKPENAEYLGTENVDGVGTIGVSLRFKGNPNDMRMEYRFATSRGLLPIRIDDIDAATGKVRRSARIVEAKECSNDRWFPTKCVLIYDLDEKPPYRVERYEVTELEVDSPPSDEDFSLLFVEKHGISIPGKEGPYVDAIQPGTRVLGADLQSLYDGTVDTGERRAKQLEATTGEPYEGASRNSFRLWIMAVCIVGAVILAVVLGRRRQA